VFAGGWWGRLRGEGGEPIRQQNKRGLFIFSCCLSKYGNGNYMEFNFVHTFSGNAQLIMLKNLNKPIIKIQKMGTHLMQRIDQNRNTCLCL